VTGLLARIREQPPEVLEAIAHSMNVRASEPAMRAICARYMARITLPEGAHVLEVGCGNGAATKLIMQHINPGRLVGIDPSSTFVDMARETFAGEPRVSFALGDAVATGQGDACFDLVIAHTVYSHLVDPEEALTEAHRVLRPGGQLVIFDGDFATLTVALFDGDPLQAAVGGVLRNLVHAPYIMRRLPALVTSAGFSLHSVEPHGYVQTSSPDYLLTLLSRGSYAAVQAGEISQEVVDSFDREARRRVANGTFYGAMLFLSLTACKGGDSATPVARRRPRAERSTSDFCSIWQRIGRSVGERCLSGCAGKVLPAISRSSQCWCRKR
jgi:ubiquinone/menaquinone biosynthesis C-methylase UbiE